MTQDIGSLRKEAISLATQAIAFDDKKEYDEAIKHYTKAVEKLNYITKMDENPLNKEIYLKKAKEYYDRVMELKKAATDNEPKKQAVTEGDK
jgi:tetratricopeptide (TPR) repeat protein